MLLRAIQLTLAALVLANAAFAQAQPALNETLPVDQVRPGMQGYAYTIFAGDQVEKFDLEVIGVMPNFLGPKQSIILVQLKGPKVEHTGVVAGMSGSPVYIDGKLAGALSLKLGVFTKEPIAGVTPIADVLAGGGATALAGTAETFAPRATISDSLAGRAGIQGGSELRSIETPLIFSGFQPAAIQKFSDQLGSLGFVAAQGGTTAARPDDAQLAPGDMAGMVLVQGDVSINSACTVTAIQGDHVFLCGHPFLNLGEVQLPMARSRVLTTLSSDLASTKIVNAGGPIGTIVSDHLTAVTGKLGPAPAMIPLELNTKSPLGTKTIHAQIVNHPKLTPLLVGITTFNGMTQNIVYGETTTLKMNAEIKLKDHAPVRIENTFAPSDAMSPDGMPVAMAVMGTFMRLFNNAFEKVNVESVSVNVESIPGRRSFTIESAWLEKGEAAPGETLRLRVLLQPYRGTPRIEETSVRVPDQVLRGSTLRLMVSDADWMNRASRGFAGAGGPGGPEGLDPLISLINRERRNDRLYVGLFVPSPTMLWDDKELPNVPLSQINAVDGRPAPGSVQILRESLASEVSVPMSGPVTGIISLNLPIR
ncbi:MAG TPA: SpoIVB peptidase S55 domain-containing protein [Candidatus Acidoferrum sp.]|nr:SpoIVB peptidase S55 domain-containing protein [Candidatus Acidoferrum sp.]